MRKLPFHTLDVFTEEKFAGNPLAVVFEADGLETAAMQTIAREFNLSETIFVRTPKDFANTCAVRIFTPERELPFAGHPTVGCAVLLASLKQKEGCSFETRLTLEAPAGLIPVTVTRIGGPIVAKLTAPKIATAAAVKATSAEIASALGIAAADVGLTGHAAMVMNAGNPFMAAPVRSLEALARTRIAEPSFSALTKAEGSMGIYPYTVGEKAEWRARLFAPAASVPEDPATGSAAAAFPAVLLAAGKLAAGTANFAIEQGVEMGRPSRILVEADVDAGALKAVRIAGSAVRVTEGILLLD